GQQAVDVLHGGRVQGTGRLFEQQPVAQVVVARAGVVLPGLEQVLLVDQHVDDGTRTDFQADLRSVVRTLRRNQRQAPRLDLADARDQRLVGVAGIALDRAPALLELVLGDVAAGDRLAHARLGGAAGEDRHGQGQAQGVAFVGQADGAGRGRVPAGVVAVVHAQV